MEHATRKALDLKLTLPADYRSYLNLRETEHAIKYIKDNFQNNLTNALNLTRVSAPIIVLGQTGVNDYLNGWEKPVSFQIRDMQQVKGEVVQSLAKWKRKALADYRFEPGEGLYTDMNAIRPDEELDNLHSLYVDQWDWERIIHREERTILFLQSIVNKIYDVLKSVKKDVCNKYPSLAEPFLPDEIYFIHSEELLEKYPDLSPAERENAICREKGAVFVIGIGARLKNGKPHDGRASDYDDWSTETGNGYKGLNGDILVWYPLLNQAFELSSMGIRVDENALRYQLEISNELYKTKLDFHKRLLNNELPLTIGGGIGQSRLCMFFLQKAHIGEVQSSIWPAKMRQDCLKKDIPLL